MVKAPVIVKKYANRRLYDGEESRYVTLDELAAKVKRGVEVRVVDAVTGDDLTQATLAQVILESRGGARLLPTALLVQLVRLGDDALAEFFQRYVSWALELYLSARHAPSPFEAVTGVATSLSRPFANANPLLRPFFPPNPWSDAAYGARGPTPPPASPAPSEARPEAHVDDERPARRHARAEAERGDLDALRAELQELRSALLGAVAPSKQATRPKTATGGKPAKQAGTAKPSKAARHPRSAQASSPRGAGRARTK